MTAKITLLSGLLLIAAQFVFAENAPLFTNENLKKYDGAPEQQWTSNDQPASEHIYPRGGMINRANDAGQSQSYCSQANRLREQITRDRDSVAAAQRKTIGRKVYDASIGRYMMLYVKDEAAIAAAQKNLEASQARLEQFEEEARKNDIPPGWLRCDK